MSRLGCDISDLLNSKATKAVKALVTGLAHAYALRQTAPVEPDLKPPTASGELIHGYTIVGSVESGLRVVDYTSSFNGHAFKKVESLGFHASKGGICGWSRKVDAMRNMRFLYENHYAKMLHKLDMDIEAELKND